MADLMSDYETSADYSKESREVLEKKAEMLDCIELTTAASCWGTFTGISHTDLMETFKNADFKNYFNQ